jgi:CRISPR-associated protein Cas1
MVNEAAYCERLFYFMWVSQLFEENQWTAAGSEVHSRVDQPRIRGDSEAPDAVTALTLYSEELGLVAKLDLVEFDGRTAVPIDYKVGSPAHVEGGVWEPERVQICVQALLLREAGYRCERGSIWFHGARRRVDVDIDEELVSETMRIVARARDLAEQPEAPPPLLDSPKCPPCAVVGLCLPDETNLLSGREPRRQGRMLVPDWPGRPLYVTDPGTRVGVRGNTIELRKDGEFVSSVRLIDVDQVCVFGRGVRITTPAIHTLMSYDIPVLFFSGGGWFKGITTGLPGKDVELRRRQVVTAATDGIRFARSFVDGKIRNSRTLLRRHGSSGSAEQEVLRELGRLAEKARQAPNEQTLLGLEGMAAKRYFASFNSMLEEPGEFFQFEGRSRRPPRDPINALLSFVYGLLVKEITVAALGVGFDPYLGFFHRPRFGRPALALDLAEEFRPLIGDSTVLMLVNNGELRPSHFVGRPGQAGLTREGRQRVIRAFERRLDVEATHHVFGYRVSYRRLLHLQVRLLARVIAGDIPDYVPFTPR